MNSYFCLLILFIGLGVEAAQIPSPVYRSAPTVLKTQAQQQRQLSPPPQQQQQQQQQPPEQPLQIQPSQQQQQPTHSLTHVAEERESTAYGTGETPSSGASPKVTTVQGGQVGGAAPAKPAQEYTVMYFPQPGQQAVGQQPQPYSGYGQQAYPVSTPLTGYQQPPVAGGAGTVAPASHFWNSLNWQDTGVALACLALIGAGSALWYPNIAKLKARAMRELSEIKAEDASRMARSVMRAIQKFSELNNSKRE